MEIIVVLALMGVLAYTAARGVRRIPYGMVGLVYKRYGRRPPNDKYSVSIFGGPGPQAQTLRGNGFYWLPPLLYEVRQVPQIQVPNGTIGVVVAKAGAVKAPGSVLAKHVDCDYFRDGRRFLQEDGEQGRQQQALTSGNYEINTEMFEVITIDTPDLARREGLGAADLREIKIPIGETGVVITHMGEIPPPEGASVGPVIRGHEKFQLPWVFVREHGQIGVQQETLAEGGHYVVNPWFAHVVQVPTRVLILEWTKNKKSDSNLDISLEQISLDVQGYTVRLDMKQTVQIPAEAAPGLVRRFGDLGGTGYTAGRAPVRHFVEKDLAATVAGYFRRICARYKIQEFITKYDDVCIQLAAEVRQALEDTHVRAIDTTLEEFECDQPEINEIRRLIANQQEQVKLEQARLEELKAKQANEEVLNKIALQQTKVDKERAKLKYVEHEVLVDLLGPQQVSRERIVERLVEAKVPHMVSVGNSNGDVDPVSIAMPLMQVRDVLQAISNEPVKPPEDRPPAITDGRRPDASNDDDDQPYVEYE